MGYGGDDMLHAERRDYLLTALRRDGKIVAKQVASDLGVSEDSVRRDLRELAAEGLCQRVYGGALPTSPALADLEERRAVSPESKQRVAAEAVKLVRPGSSIILDGGTTTLAIAAALPKNLSCMVITHSPTIAAALVQHPNAEVFILGGKLFKHSVVACGSAAVEAAEHIRADMFFLGVTGIHPDEGLTTGDPDEAAMKRALANRSAETYVLGSAEKIGAASPFQVIPFESATAVITDAAQSLIMEELRAKVEVIPAR